MNPNVFHPLIKPIAYLVRIVYGLAAALSMVAAFSITASMLIAERAPQTGWYWGVTLTASMFIALLGLLILGIACYLADVGLRARTLDCEPAAAAMRSWLRLCIIMIICGLMLCGLLLICVYAILARIDQGFAVFG